MMKLTYGRNGQTIKSVVGLIVCILLMTSVCVGFSGMNAEKAKNSTLEEALDAYVNANFTADAKALGSLLPKDYFEKKLLEDFETEGKYEASVKEYMSQYIISLTKLDSQWTYSYIVKKEEGLTAEEIEGIATVFNLSSEQPKQYTEGKRVVISFSITVSGHEMTEEARSLDFISDGEVWYISPGAWDNLSFDIKQFVKKIS